MLPRARRLTSRTAIRRIVSRGRRFATKHVLLRVQPARDGGTRFGFVVSTKVAKRATVRNRLKRVLREIVRSKESQFPASYEYLFTVLRQPTHDTKTFSEEIHALLFRR